MKMKSVRLAAVAFLVLLGACGDSGPGSGAPEEVTGVIVDIESEGIGEVTSFELKDGDELYTIRIDPEVEYNFDLGHLHEHLQGSEPVRVDLESRDGFLFATTIEDA